MGKAQIQVQPLNGRITAILTILSSKYLCLAVFIMRRMLHHSSEEQSDSLYWDQASAQDLSHHPFKQTEVYKGVAWVSHALAKHLLMSIVICVMLSHAWLTGKFCTWCYNFSYPELPWTITISYLLIILIQSLLTQPIWHTYSKLSQLYCGAQSAQSPFRLFFSWLLSFTDHDTLCLTHNP